MAHTQGGHRGQDIDNDYGRFGRMFPDARGPVFDRKILARLGKSMIKKDEGKPYNQPDDDENGPSSSGPGLPAAYTYFGQFVDHDITLDLTGLGEQEADAQAVQNFRSARLDLDCVYGHGLGSSRFFYDAGAGTFQRSGRIISPSKPGMVQTKRDLFRAPNGTALIGDHRNDENVIVAQIQQAFTECHNKIMASNQIIDASVTGQERFRAAARTVRHHYQWVVLKDYLKRITDPAVYDAMVPKIMGAAPFLKYYNADNLADYPFMPIEFAGAAYRFGHSMVRPSYALNAVAGTGPGALPGTTRIPIFDVRPGGQDLRGFGQIAAGRGIDWAYLLELNGTPPSSGFPASGDLPFLWQPAYRIDSLLVDPLAQLPDHMSQLDPDERSLAFLNLLRGSKLQLPTAEQVAERMSLPTEGFGAFPLLSHDDIWSFGSKHMDVALLAGAQKTEIAALITERKAIGNALRNHTPLWYYILREAEFTQAADANDIFGGRRLGAMGSILVLETFLALLWLDDSSVMHVPGWRPHPKMSGSTQPDKFELKDLIRFALS